MRELESHPADEIRGSVSNHLSNIKIGFGLTGSVAIYRVIDVMRELIRRGAEIHAIMSKAATELLNPTLVEWAIGSKVLTEFKGEVGHVSLSKEVSSFAIAPATADIISKLAHGVCDNPVSLSAVNMLGLKKPVIVVPAMHSGLWYSPPVNEAMKKLEEFGVVVVPPDISDGRAKLPENDDIIAAVEASTLRGRDLRNIRILVTAGPTREYLDRVRFLTNASSGKMGVAIAREAYFRGADVTLVHGPLTVRKPHYIRSISVTTTEEMFNAVLSEVRSKRYDAVILAAAPADFRFRKYVEGKIKSDVGPLTVELETTPKISLGLRKEFSGFLVGFAAEIAEGEVNKLAELALEKLEKRGFDIIVANDVSRSNIGFAADYNEVLLISRRGRKELVSRTLKEVIARKILDLVKEELGSAR
ncbi:MAG: bifunctional phosphopantothenoylcysteine decarboxylase/phosphopantothenate--cysteine ligase CoaBC [Desulfurococcaceae archaeon TW002]